MANPIIALNKITGAPEKYWSVIILKEDGGPGISPGARMIKRSWKLDSQWSSHES
jgi:hypothetical protein